MECGAHLQSSVGGGGVLEKAKAKGPNHSANLAHCSAETVRRRAKPTLIVAIDVRSSNLIIRNPRSIHQNGSDLAGKSSEGRM